MKKLIIGIFCLSLFGCKVVTRSSFTGTPYNSPAQDGYLKVNYVEQETGPGLVLIKGGYFDYTYNSVTKEVLIPSFYMDETEVTNQAWVDYMHWTKRTFTDFPLVYTATIPDKSVWLEKGSYNEPLATGYLKHPSYQNYPVVGISWLQAMNYCAWRTDRVNEYILIRVGILLWNSNQQNEPFTTGAYLAGQFSNSDNPTSQLIDLDPGNGGGQGRNKIRKKDLATRIVKLEDGILLPKYRLPTAAEWEYAFAISTTKDKRRFGRKELEHKNKEARTIVKLPVNGQSTLLTPVNSYWPNDYGLYCMSGNVSEWVLDTYLEGEEVSNYSPFSGGNTVLTEVLNSESRINEKLNEVIYDVPAIVEYTKQLQNEYINNSKGVITDSMDIRLLNRLESEVNSALGLWNEGMKREASRYMRDIVESILPDIGFSAQSIPGFESYQFEIIPVFTKGISQFIIDKPGNIRFETIKPEVNLTVQNKLTPEMLQFIPSLQFDLDKNQSSEAKIFKGKNWRDTNDVTQVRYLNKYASSSTIGFRCAMDRLGAVKE